MTFLLGAGNSVSHAQCLVDSISINTGYDFYGNAPIALGGTDTNWSVTFLSTDCIPYAPPLSLPYNAYAVYWTGGAWLHPTNSQFISFLNQYYIPTTVNNSYKMTLHREFRTCLLDSFIFDFDIAVDNWVQDLRIDGVSRFHQGGSSSSNWTSYQNWVYGEILSPGTHTIDVDIPEDNITLPINPFGLDIEGTIVSGLSHNSIIDNICPTYECSDGGKAAPATGIVNTASNKPKISVSPNPMSDWLTVNYAATNNQMVRFTLYNTVGVCVLTVNEHMNGNNEVKLPVSNLAPGLYVLYINDGTAVHNIKVVKQ